jgi:hypothetical protein
MFPKNPQQKKAIQINERIRNNPGSGMGGSLNGISPSIAIPRSPTPPQLQTVPQNPFPGVSGLTNLGPKTIAPHKQRITLPAAPHQNIAHGLPGTTPVSAGAGLIKVPNQNRVKFPKLYKTVKF